MAVIVVVRCGTEDDAERHRVRLVDSAPVGREKRYVLYLTGLGSGAFGRRVFARLTS